MYILYLDESGTHGEASYFVLAGLAVFEREIHWFREDLDALQLEYFPDITEPVFFHARLLRVRDSEQLDEPWNRISTEQRYKLKEKVYDIIRRRHAVVFGCAVEKRYCLIRGENPYERAFEDLISRFDLFLSRVNREGSAEDREVQRGLIVLAESSYEKTIALLAQRLQQAGTRWRSLHNVTDVPYFAPARDTRLLQYADFCSNAIYGRYHAKLTGDFESYCFQVRQRRRGGPRVGSSHD